MYALTKRKRGNNLTIDERSKIASLANDGYEDKEIATKMGIKASTVRKWKDFDPNGNMNNKKGQGNKKMLTDGQQTLLIRAIHQCIYRRGMTEVEMLRRFGEHPNGIQITSRCFHNYLSDFRRDGKVPANITKAIRSGIRSKNGMYNDGYENNVENNGLYNDYV